MNVRPALLAAAAFAATGTALALGRWAAEGNRELAGLLREVQRGEELPPRLEEYRRRIEAQRALAAEVVAGKLSLREAAGHFRRLDDLHPGLPPGTSRPAADERALCDRVLDSAWEVLADEGRFAEGARWYAEVFAAHPHLLAVPPTSHRYFAARLAARAGCGQGQDATGLDEESRAGFRHQALGWLRAELEAQRRLLEREPAKNRAFIAGGLGFWLLDPHFAGVRGPEALGRLPEPERQGWQKLWADVADTLARAEGTAPPEPKAGDKRPVPER
jgi:hypothetical protein